MAERRMFTKKVTDSDAFIEMSSAAQALYFHLNQGADDDGFNNQIQIAMLKAHASTDDLKVLLAKNFIIRFESGVIVIKHWRMHNTLRKDRHTPTNFQEELHQLGLKENGAYSLGCQTVAKRLPQGSKVEVSEIEVRSSEDSVSAGDPTLSEADNVVVAMWREHGITLTMAEARELEAKLTPQVFDRYFHNLDNFLRRNPTARTGSQYELILRWAREDGAA